MNSSEGPGPVVQEEPQACYTGFLGLILLLGPVFVLSQDTAVFIFFFLHKVLQFMAFIGDYVFGFSLAPLP